MNQCTLKFRTLPIYQPTLSFDGRLEFIVSSGSLSPRRILRMRIEYPDTVLRLEQVPREEAWNEGPYWVNKIREVELAFLGKSH